MDTQEQLKVWQKSLQTLQLGQDIPPKLQVILRQTIQACQAASALFSTAQPVIFQSQRADLSYQEAFQDLMRVEARRNAVWNLWENVMSLWEAMMGLDDEPPAGDALGAILDIRLGLTDRLDKLAEVNDIWIERKTFNEAIRPFARPLTIFDIPMELWSHIFEEVIGEEEDDGNLWLFPDYVSGGRSIKSIKSSRLACRRFCDASSPFLLRRVDVALNPESLARLDQISRHSAFSMCVRAVRIDLSCYSCCADWAQDESAFVKGTISAVCRWLHLDSETLQLYDQSRVHFFSQFLPIEQVDEAVDKIRRAVASWLRYLCSGCKIPSLNEDDVENSTENVAAVTAIRGCYQEYQRRAEAQDKSRLHGRPLARSVAEAVARMPKAVRLFMTDDMNYVCEAHHVPVHLQMMESLDSLKDLTSLLRATMLKPSMTWVQLSEEFELDLQPPPARLLYLLPMAFQEARVPLLHLEINITWHHLVIWEPDECDFASLCTLAKTLKVVDYHGPPEPDTRSIRRYLGTLMSGQQLQKVGIEFEQERAESIEVGPLLESFSPGTEIRSLTLRSCSLHLDELKSALQKCNSSEMSLILHGLELLSGTWADALDLLRDSAMRVVSVQRPMGMECDDLSREAYNKLFASGPNPDYKTSKANQYISGWPYGDISTHNPLRPGPDPVPVADDASPGTNAAQNTAQSSDDTLEGESSTAEAT